jgi:hypothetical protein
MTGWEPPAPPDGRAPFSFPVAETEAILPGRRRSKWKVWVPVAGVVVAALVATVLLVPPSGGKTTIEILRSAPDTTAAAGSAQIRGGVTLTVEGETHGILKFRGASDFGAEKTDFKVSGSGVVSKVRVIGGVEYFSQSLVPLPGGAKWVRITKADIGLAGETPISLGSSDPSQGLQFMAAASGDPQLTGHEDVDGTDTAHYTFTFDMTTITDKLAKVSDKLGVSQLAEGIAKLGNVVDLHHLPAEAWIDGDGRVVRFDYTLEIPGPNGEKVTEVSDLRFSQFGEPVIVAVPPAADVVPFSQVPNLFKQMMNAAQAAAS